MILAALFHLMDIKHLAEELRDNVEHGFWERGEVTVGSKLELFLTEWSRSYCVFVLAMLALLALLFL